MTRTFIVTLIFVGDTFGGAITSLSPLLPITSLPLDSAALAERTFVLPPTVRLDFVLNCFYSKLVLLLDLVLLFLTRNSNAKDAAQSDRVEGILMVVISEKIIV